MTLLAELKDPARWEAFYEYKTSLVCPKQYTKELRSFIDNERYLPVCDETSDAASFPLPRRAVISKIDTKKKRIVYIYPKDETTVLKLLTYLLLRKYDGIFSANLYSFRPGKTAKDAIRRLTGIPGIRGMYSYKVDISNYFNSIPIERFLPILKETLSDDAPLYEFLSALLKKEEVSDRGKIICEEKGIMAGTPLAAFYANLYLKDMDEWFESSRIPYARYSDDIIVFGKTREETESYAAKIKELLAAKGLSVNPDKELFSTPDEGWTFLGFCEKDGVIDIAPVTLMKLKKKMRRKARALRRWSDRHDEDGERAARAFIRVFNRKLMENAGDNELTWSYWFFSVINTTESLHAIDLYAQDCIRFLYSGTRKKSRFNARYEDLKALGYKSLVNDYYAFSEKMTPTPNRKDIRS
jgi:hypothetical protein